MSGVAIPKRIVEKEVIYIPPGLETESPEEPLIVPGPRGLQGLKGNTGLKGKDGLFIPGMDADQPEEPMIIPGPRGLKGDAGSGSITMQSQPYNAGDFTGSGAMIWTVTAGNLIHFRYGLLGKLLFINFAASGTTVSGTPDIYLQIKIPGGKTSLNLSARNAIIVVDNNINKTGHWFVLAGNNLISISIPTFNWSLSAGLTAVLFSGFFEIQ